MSSLAYRLAVAADLPFVVDYWVSNWRTAHAAGLIAMEDWYEVMEPQVRKVLARPGVEVWVACHPEAEQGIADLYGFAVVEHDVRVPVRRRVNGRWQDVVEDAGCPLVHYVAVKQPYRRMGVARGLLLAAGVDPSQRFLYTCKTPVVSKLPIRHARWAPLIARYPKERPLGEDSPDEVHRVQRPGGPARSPGVGPR